MSQDLAPVAPVPAPSTDIASLDTSSLGDLVPAEQAQRLAALDALADKLRTERRANTAAAYADDWKAWQRYTTEVGIPETATTAGAWIGFVGWLSAQGYALTTIDRRLAGVAVTMRDRGLIGKEHPPVTEAREELAKLAHRLAEQGETRGRGQAPALTVPQLRAITAACPDTLIGTRDRSLVLLAFCIAARRSEVAGLLLSDVRRVDGRGMTVNIRFGKTGKRTVAIPYGTHRDTCPVRAWEAWLAASGITEGPALRRVDRHGRILGGMSPQAVGQAIARAAERAGVEGITGHSARSGLVTASRGAGHDAKTISQTTGHVDGSGQLQNYIRIVDQWTDNALNGIGL